MSYVLILVFSLQTTLPFSCAVGLHVFFVRLLQFLLGRKARLPSISSCVYHAWILTSVDVIRHPNLFPLQ